MKYMKQFSSVVMAMVCAIVIFLMAFKPQKDTFNKITVREFELVDEQGEQRVSIKVEQNGEVLLRLRDSNGTIRVKLGANEEGSGLLLLDSETNPGIHALAKKGRVFNELCQDKKLLT